MATRDISGKGRGLKAVKRTPPNERTPLEVTCHDRYYMCDNNIMRYIAQPIKVSLHKDWQLSAQLDYIL